MNRRQFLQRLFEKNDYRHEQINMNFHDKFDLESPPAMIKRMQIMQLGCARIGAPLNKKLQQPIILNRNNDKKHQRSSTIQNEASNQPNLNNNHSSNKRVFVLQRNKHQKKKKQTEKQQNLLSSSQTPYTRLNSDITKQINNCLTKERMSAQIINISSKNQSIGVNSQSYHSKTTQSPNKSPQKWVSSRKKVSSIKNELRASEILRKTKQIDSKYQSQFQQQRTNRSEVKSMYMKAPDHINISKISPPLKNDNLKFRRKFSNTALQNKIPQQKQQKNKKIMLRKQIHKTYTKQFTPPPKITSKAFIIIEKNAVKKFFEPKDNNNTNIIKQNFTHQNHKVHLSFNSKSSVQVASLTKIMTCIVAIQLCQRYSLDPKKQIIRVGKYQSHIGGTSAKIRQGDVYTLFDLYFGLMLPSGNDASLAIAVWGGKVLYGNGNTNLASTNLDTLNQQKNKINKKISKKTQYYNRFLMQMNIKAKQLQMSKTNYANSHGLINTMNKSCAYDIAMLSIYAMQNQQFRNIVSTKQYSNTIKHQQKIILKVSETTISTSTQAIKFRKQKIKKDYNNDDIEVDQNQSISNQDQSEEQQERSLFQQQIVQTKPKTEIIQTYRQVYWQNTHKLLHKPNSKYIGIKTGVTTAAGPCLSSCVRTNYGRQFYIVVLNCKKMLLRFKETDILRKWIFKQENISLSKSNNIKKGTESVKTYSCVDSQFENQDLGEEEDENYED